MGRRAAWVAGVEIPGMRGLKDLSPGRDRLVFETPQKGSPEVHMCSIGELGKSLIFADFFGIY